MEVLFQIQYNTKWGERVCVAFPSGQIHPLDTYDGTTWRGLLTLEPADFPLSYRYVIQQGGEIARKEWAGVPRRLTLNKTFSRIILNDAWRDRPADSFLYTSALAANEKQDAAVMGGGKSYDRAILLKVRCPQLRNPKWKLAMSGNQSCLGNWNLKKPIFLTPCGPNEWGTLLDASQVEFPLEYKFFAWDPEENRVAEWMTGDNRHVNPVLIKSDELYVLHDDEIHFDLPKWKAAGVAIPVFSLRSESSWGVGDFGDLKKFVDWAVLTGQKVIQILPINDTTITHTWTDSYPYNSISIYAFNPIYIDVSNLPPLKDKTKMVAYEKERKRLNALPQMDYEGVIQLKMNYLKELFEQDGKRVLKLKDFQNFYAANEDWLPAYAVFSYLRDVNGTPAFSRWKQYSTYNKEEVQALYESSSECKATADFHYYLQFILHTQLLAASKYARSKKVLLKGDIPIGISPNSVEAWTEPHLFNLNGQAGAPPDPFSAKGQNWGFPTYNWEVMAKDNFSWWKRRMRKMSEYFDAYRIDHILGFFRIWEIPSHSVEGLLGQFVPSLPLSASDIERYGLHFRKDSFTKPYIPHWLLERIFGKLTDEVKRTFLCQITVHEYALLPPYQTQRQVQAYFEGKTDRDSLLIRDGLYELINDVLFVPDRNDASRYHPRIAAQQSPVYQSLTLSEQRSFDALYEDYYYHRHDAFWREEALKKLPELIDSTRMLVCGEDLGMIPGCVKGVMEELRILGLEIQRMPKQYGVTFDDPAHYPYLSVCAISTHDMSTLRGWWHEDLNMTQQYYEKVLHGWGECPKEAPGWICDTIVMNHLLGNSMLAILSFQDWLSINENVRCSDPDSERINVPANPRHYWRYRMHLTIEELLNSDFLNRRIFNMIQKSGRG